MPFDGAHLLDFKTSEAARRVLAVFDARSSLLERIEALSELAARLGAASWSRPRVSGEMRALQIRDFLRDHPSDHIEISHLASLVSLTPFHLIRLFHRAVGIPPHSYATLVRVNYSERFLRAGVPIVEAAGKAGFCDQSHLTRCFRRVLGITPGQYQRVYSRRIRPAITAERVMAYRLRSGEKLWRYWSKLRAARARSARR